MKICWDALEKLRFTKRDKFVYGTVYYIEKEESTRIERVFKGVRHGFKKN